MYRARVRLGAAGFVGIVILAEVVLPACARAAESGCDWTFQGSLAGTVPQLYPSQGLDLQLRGNRTEIAQTPPERGPPNNESGCDSILQRSLAGTVPQPHPPQGLDLELRGNRTEIAQTPPERGPPDAESEPQSLFERASREKAPRAEETAHQLQLEVYLNGAPTRLIGSFIRLSGRQLAATRAELVELGIKVPGAGAGDERIVVNNLAGVSYRYDEPTQSIFFTLGDRQRVTQTYDLRSGPETPPAVRGDLGAVLNYNLFGASTKSFNAGAVSFTGANASLDGRVFGPYGTLGQSAILGATTARDLDALRLETNWTYTVPQKLLTYRVGDTISGGLAWTRPIRLGGVQVQRNFALRPDLVTMPLPSISGNAAVPSTLDVYVDNLKVSSRAVPSGPYQIVNIPVLSSAGTARVVVQDAAGRQIETSLPFFSSPILLREGLTDFSLEAGLPRLFYGTISNSYVANPVGSASLRSGLYDGLTLEAHAEGGAGLRNLGAGTVTRLGSAGVLSVAASGSQASNALGLQTYLAFDSQIMGLDFHASSLQTFGSFNDLASVTARFLPALSVFSGVSALGTTALPLLTSNKPPKSLDIASISLPVPFDASRINLGFVHSVFSDGLRSDFVNVSYSRSLFADVSAYLTAFTDLRGKKSSGVFVGLSMPLGNFASSVGPVMASTNVSATPRGTGVTTDLVKTLQPEPDSYGWRLQGREGNTPYHAAAASYRSSFAQFDGGVLQLGRDVNFTAQAQGAVAAMGGGMFLANRIDDAFAVVNVGAPGVDVRHENRPAGKTDADGQLLIPNLRSYQANSISIDARDLPLDADAPVTHNFVVPADRSGVRVDFGINTDVKAAVVILSDKAGNFIVPGVRGHLEGAKEAFVVGYDGRAYVKGLGAANSVAIDLGGSECRASFPFTPQKNTQIVIGPVVCR